jgi:hypothetical protein
VTIEASIREQDLFGQSIRNVDLRLDGPVDILLVASWHTDEDLYAMTMDLDDRVSATPGDSGTGRDGEHQHREDAGDECGTQPLRKSNASHRSSLSHRSRGFLAKERGRHSMAQPS